MPNELNIALATTGLTVTAQPYQNGAAVGSAISCPETGSTGFYSGNMAGSAGTYQIAFRAAGANVGSGSIVWDGTAEVAPSTLTAAQVNAEADTALADVGLTSTVTGRIDAAISSRLSPSGTLAVVTTLTNAPTSVTPSDIWSHASRTLTSASGPTAVEIRQEIDANSTKLDAAISTRLAGSAYTAPANSDISAIKSKTDNIPASPAAVADIPTTAQIATAVEGSLLNEADGSAVLNAIVGAIGNQNLSEVSLVAAVRADLERTGGKLDSIPTTSAPTAAQNATAVWGAATRSVTGGTVDTLTNAPASVTPSDIWSYNARTLTSASGPTAVQIRQEMDSNSTQLSAIKAKTDNLPADPADQSLLEAAIAGVTAPSAATVASAVRSELSVELARVDQAVSTRLAGSAYTAPANSDVAAIKVKTDALNSERLANVATTAIVGNLIAQANS
jgi:hypothetical protein